MPEAWDELKLTVARNLTFDLAADGLGAVVPTSGFRQPIGAIEAELMRACLAGLGPRDAVETTARALASTSPQAVERSFEQLRAVGVLVRTAGDSTTSGTYSTYSTPDLHYNLVCDYSRTLSYRAAIERVAPGRVMLEIGSGSGILACFAAIAGAKKVYAIEEGAIIEVARAVAKANGVADQIEFIAQNSINVDLGERVDVVFSELISSKPFGQRMMPVLADAARRFLKPDGVMIPSRIEYFATGVESGRFLRSEAQRVRPDDSQALRRAYGLNLDPLLDAASAVQRPVRYYEQFLGQGLPQSDRVLAPAVSIASYALSAAEVADRRVDFELLPQVGGVLNAVSTSFVARLDDTTTLSTLPSDPHQHSAWSQIAWEVDPQAVRPNTPARFSVVLSPTSAEPLTFERS